MSEQSKQHTLVAIWIGFVDFNVWWVESRDLAATTWQNWNNIHKYFCFV